MQDRHWPRQIPVHDSFIVLASLADEMSDLMRNTVKDQHDIDIGITSKTAYVYSGPTGIVDDDIHEPSTDEDKRYLSWMTKNDQKSR